MTPMTLSFQSVHSRFAQGFKNLLPKVALGSLLAVAGFVSAPNAAQAFIPAYTTSPPDAVKGFQPTSSTELGSFGFFFDTDKDISIDGLGFSSQDTWGNGKSYNVTLWKYINNGDFATDYTQLATQTFTHGTPYDFTSGYFWQSIAPLTLANSVISDPTILQGYVIGVIGDFSNAAGNVAAEGGSASFLTGILNNSSGSSFQVGDPACLYPVPACADGTGATAYFNGNFSYSTPPVPGPLPLLGAAAGFSFSRRLRKRIQATR
jgi:hypothetical protein